MDVESVALRKEYKHESKDVSVVAIEELSFKVSSGEVVAIVGSTGCGKSTFLKIVLGIEAPTKGKVIVDGREPYREFNYFRGKIAAVFQEDRLLPWRTALDNVKLGLEILGIPDEEAKKIAREWLEKLGLGRFLNSYPSELSGGMRQRVALARALALDPQLILFDEAFGHLDEVTSRKLRNDFLSLTSNKRMTTLMVTHNLEEALETAERILVFGRPAKLLADVKLEDMGEEKERIKKKINTLIERNISLNLLKAD